VALGVVVFERRAMEVVVAWTVTARVGIAGALLLAAVGTVICGREQAVVRAEADVAGEKDGWVEAEVTEEIEKLVVGGARLAWGF